MDQNPTASPHNSEPVHPTEPYPHHDLPLEVAKPAAGPQVTTWTTAGPAPTPPAPAHHQPATPAWSSAPTTQHAAHATPAWSPPTSEGALPPQQPNSASFGAGLPSSDGIQPVPVVRVLSPVGVEYVFLTFTLIVGAVGLTAALLSMVNGKFDFAVLSFPAALLLVSVPLFATLFLHLKKLELSKPSLKLDPSKRRSTQFTQITMFVVCFFTVIGLVFDVFAKIGGQSGVSIGKALLDAGVILLVAGGILAYYWNDEHRNRL